jgi:ligand-binding SRPBCC domain-containing protein
MTARVTALEPPRTFTDGQVRGPFDAFEHEHVFEPDGDSTLMRDVFGSDLPGRWLGLLVARVVVAPYLHKLLRERGEHLRDLAESAPMV